MDKNQSDFQQLFLDSLKAKQKEEILRGVTTIGPHRDELRFIVNDLDMGDYGSRGQIRTTMLALKLAELEFSIYEVARIVELTKRRVNALEYVLIPELEKTIKDITSKLEENERSTTIRLMKIKEILSKRSY